MSKELNQNILAEYSRIYREYSARQGVALPTEAKMMAEARKAAMAKTPSAKNLQPKRRTRKKFLGIF